MNVTGIVVGLASFAVIGVFHPVVIKTEYHFGKKVWPLFLAAGILSCAASLLIENPVGSSLAAVLGFSLFWSVKELHEQERRVKKDWFPANPERSSKE